MKNTMSHVYSADQKTDSTSSYKNSAFKPPRVCHTTTRNEAMPEGDYLKDRLSELEQRVTELEAQLDTLLDAVSSYDHHSQAEDSQDESVDH